MILSTKQQFCQMYDYESLPIADASPDLKETYIW